MNDKKKVLFISHDANRAGSQLLLLQLLKHLRKRGVPMHLLLCNGGELEGDFEKIVSITRLYPEERSVLKKPIAGKILKKVQLFKHYEKRFLKEENDRIIAELKSKNIGLVFVNSIANAEVFHTFLPFFHDLPVVLFAHELAMSVKIYTRESHLDFLLSKTQHLIAVSKAVSSYYVTHFNFPKEQVSTFTLIDHHFIDKKRLEASPKLLETNYGIPSDALVIGGCGNAEWRKGNDIFNWIARSVIRQTTPLPVYFVWIGAGPQHEIYELIENDIKNMGLAERIVLIPPTPQALDYIARFDVFLLSSREDPYPLVVLEAALLEIPVVCFQDAGGAPELIESDAGYAVPFLDFNAASDAITRLVKDPELRKTMGKTARRKVLERHNTTKSIDNVEAIIQKYLPLNVSEQLNQ